MDYKELGITDEQYEKLKTVSEDANAKYGKTVSEVGDLIIASQGIGNAFKDIVNIFKGFNKHINEFNRQFKRIRSNRFKKMRVGGKRF